MKRGWIVYHRDEAVKNRIFINMLQENAGRLTGERRTSLKLVFYEQIIPEISGGRERSYFLSRGEKPDIVINRTRDVRISRWCEENDIRVWNSSFITAVGNDKWKALCFFRENIHSGIIKFPETFYKAAYDADAFFERLDSFVSYERKSDNLSDISNENRKSSLLNIHDKADKDTCDISSGNDEEIFGIHDKKDKDRRNISAEDFISECMRDGRKAVIKTVSGHGGQEVFLLDMAESDKKKLSGQIKKIRSAAEGKGIIVQEFIPSDSRDMRVYIMNDSIYAAVLRKGSGDFRSNFSLGGKASPVPREKTEEYSAGIKEFIDLLKGQSYSFIGLDFLISGDGKLVFNEIEEMCGTRMLYASSELDIVKDLVKLI